MQSNAVFGIQDWLQRRLAVTLRSVYRRRVDARGFGNSQDAEGLGRTAFVSDLVLLFDALELRRANRVGQSMGGATAVQGDAGEHLEHGLPPLHGAHGPSRYAHSRACVATAPVIGEHFRQRDISHDAAQSASPHQPTYSATGHFEAFAGKLSPNLAHAVDLRFSCQTRWTSPASTSSRLARCGRNSGCALRCACSQYVDAAICITLQIGSTSYARRCSSMRAFTA